MRSGIQRFATKGVSMDREEAHHLLRNAKYTFAKTMPKNPHYYSVRTEWEDEAVFEDLVKFIRLNGHREKYGGRWYTCYVFDGWKYWTMGWPVRETTIINRCEAPE